MRSLFKILRWVQRIQSNECTCLRTSVGQTKSSGTPVEPIGEPVSYSRSQTKVNGFLQPAAIPIKSKTLYPLGLTRKVSFSAPAGWQEFGKREYCLRKQTKQSITVVTHRREQGLIPLADRNRVARRDVRLGVIGSVQHLKLTTYGPEIT